MRVVIEQALNDLPEKDCKVIWDRYVQFQHNIGDLASMNSIESRRAEALKIPGRNLFYFH